MYVCMYMFYNTQLSRYEIEIADAAVRVLIVKYKLLLFVFCSMFYDKK